jgi:hypothetical protein
MGEWNTSASDPPRIVERFSNKLRSGHVFIVRGKRSDLIKLLGLMATVFIFYKTIREAFSQRNRDFDACADVDALGRHRLAPAAENVGTTVDKLTHVFLIYNPTPLWHTLCDG